MRFGEALEEERFVNVIRMAYEQGVRTFMTADAYGAGAADEMLGRALEGFDRDSYCLVGSVGHDFYEGQRLGARGFPRFTHPELRTARDYPGYLKMAVEKSLERLKTDRLDLLMLHNPDYTGYTSDSIWSGLDRLKEEGLTHRLGVAPGPANGFTLDVIQCFERFGPLIDWAMIILNPLEPWPGSLCFPAAIKHGVKVITRVVDHGGLFHGDVLPGHAFPDGDHRVYRPSGWVESGCEKIEQMKPLAEKYGVSALQLACLWNLSFEPVESVIPTFIQETGGSAKEIEEKIRDMASLPDVELAPEDAEAITQIGNNKGCMNLKGANVGFEGEYEADRWALNPDLMSVGERWGISPEEDLVCSH